MSVEIMGQLPGGAAAVPALNYSRELVTQDSLARAVERGKCFATTNQGTGIVTQAGLSGTDAILALYNPMGSGVTGRLWYAGFTSKVAAAAAAVVWVAANTNTVAAEVTGTAAVVRNLKLGNGAGNNQGQVLQAFTTATLPAAPVAICTLGSLLTGAITTVPNITPLERWFNGSLLVQPGTAISFQTSTAAGAASSHGEFIWEEVALIS